MQNTHTHTHIYIYTYIHTHTVEHEKCHEIHQETKIWTMSPFSLRVEAAVFPTSLDSYNLITPKAYHQSPITNHQPPITNHQSPTTNHPITCRVPSHLGLIPSAVSLASSHLPARSDASIMHLAAKCRPLASLPLVTAQFGTHAQIGATHSSHFGAFWGLTSGTRS
jgi:hypothetical protein